MTTLTKLLPEEIRGIFYQPNVPIVVKKSTTNFITFEPKHLSDIDIIVLQDMLKLDFDLFLDLQGETIYIKQIAFTQDLKHLFITTKYVGKREYEDKLPVSYYEKHNLVDNKLIEFPKSKIMEILDFLISVKCPLYNIFGGLLRYKDDVKILPLPIEIQQYFIDPINIQIDEIGDDKYYIGFVPKDVTEESEFINGLLGTDFDLSKLLQIVITQGLKSVLIEYYKDPENEEDFREDLYSVSAENMKKLVDFLILNRYKLTPVSGPSLEYKN